MKRLNLKSSASMYGLILMTSNVKKCLFIRQMVKSHNFKKQVTNSAPKYLVEEKQ